MVQKWNPRDLKFYLGKLNKNNNKKITYGTMLFFVSFHCIKQYKKAKKL